MKPIPRLADDMRIYLATEKMENQEILETLIESREDAEAALMTARQKVSDVFMSYILPAEKGARTKKLDHDGFLALLLELTAKYPKEWSELRDKYEADGITRHSDRLNAMVDKYEELSTIFQTMVDEAKV